MAWPLCFTYAGSVIGKGFVARVDLRDILTKTLIDFVNDSETFTVFKDKVEAFYHATDDDAAEWQAAVESIKAGTAPVPEGVRRCPDPDLFVRVSVEDLAQWPGVSTWQACTMSTTRALPARKPMPEPFLQPGASSGNHFSMR